VAYRSGYGNAGAGWCIVSDASQQVSIVVAEGLRSTTSVSDLLNRVVAVVIPRGVCAGALLRHMLGFQSAITIVSHGCVLIRAAAFCACILADLYHLIARVVG